MKWAFLLVIAANAMAWFLFKAMEPTNKVTGVYEEPVIPEDRQLYLLSERPLTIQSKLEPVADQTGSRILKAPDIEAEVSNQEEATSTAEVLQQLLPVGSCLTIGPYAENDPLVSGVKVFLVEHQATYEIKEVSVAEVRGYWVMLPKPSQAEKFEEIREQIVAVGLDAYLVPVGQWSGYISLGLFSSLENAREHLRLATAKGYSPEINEERSERKQIWILASGLPSQLIGAITDLAGAQKTRKEPCQEVASPPQFH